MNNDDLIKEFLEKGGKIEVLPPQEVEHKYIIGSLNKKVPDLKTLEEGRILYTKPNKNLKAKKEPDFSDIDISLIPESLRDIIGQDKNTKEDNIETN